jgi:hypothetical protein
VAKAALEKEHSPAAMSDYKLKKLQTVLVDQEIFLPGRREGVYSSL